MAVSNAQRDKLRLTHELASLIELHFNDLMSIADATAQQKLIAARTQAHINEADAALFLLQENEPQAQSLIQSLETMKNKIEQLLQQLQDAVAVLDLIVAAVRIGARLVNLGL